MKRSNEGNSGYGLWPIVVNLAPDNPRFPPNILGGLNQLCYNEGMKFKNIMPYISIIGLAALILVLNLTSPTEIGPFGVLLFFTTLYIIVFSIVALGLRVFYRLALKRNSFGSKDYFYAAVFAFGPIMLLMARSFGAISIWTVGLIAVFIFLAEFLVAKRI